MQPSRLIIVMFVGVSFLALAVVVFFALNIQGNSATRQNGWTAYRDNSFGYIVSVPSSWRRYVYAVPPERGYMSLFSREGLQAPLDQLVDDLSLTVRVRKVGSNQTLETFASRTERNIDGNPQGVKNTIVEQIDKVIQGQFVIVQREQVPPDADSESGYMKVLYLLREGTLYVLTVFGNNEQVIFKQVDVIDQIFERFKS